MKRTVAREIIKFRADPTLRKAIRLRATREDSEMQRVIANALLVRLAAEIAEVQALARETRSSAGRPPARTRRSGTAAEAAPHPGQA
jgi:hypothetical protein